MYLFCINLLLLNTPVTVMVCASSNNHYSIELTCGDVSIKACERNVLMQEIISILLKNLKAWTHNV